MSLHEEAKASLPDGVTHDVRRLTPFPLYMDRGRGARKWDVDGHEYIDCVMGHGALILGHCHPDIVEEADRQIRRGTHLGFNTTLELRWARAIKALMPSIEKVRFHSSGTEATMMALRLARAYTGRSRVAKLANHFHGWNDYVAVAADRHPGAGIPERTAETVLLLPAGDIGAVEKTLAADRDVAALILEPTGAKGGALPLRPEYLGQLREVTRRYGVVLIFDEVVTGFRVGPGGAQERFGVRPDLTTLAKVMAGGFPGGAVGGRAEIMEMIAFHADEEWNRLHRVSHPGTFNANPLSAAAGSRCLEMLAREPVNRRAEEAGRTLREELNRILKRRGVSGFVHGYGSLLYAVFGARCEGDLELCGAPHEDLLRSINSETTRTFRRAMLNNGVDVMSGHQFILSSVHGPKEIEDVAAGFERAVGQMQAEGAL
jgi:glutamate-1-semialdehyde 2,1-aminomutase